MHMFMKHKISIIAASAILATSSLGAYDFTHTPVDPDKYPFEMYKKETKAGKKVTTLYDGVIFKD